MQEILSYLCDPFLDSKVCNILLLTLMVGVRCLSCVVSHQTRVELRSDGKRSRLPAGSSLSASSFQHSYQHVPFPRQQTPNSYIPLPLSIGLRFELIFLLSVFMDGNNGITPAGDVPAAGRVRKRAPEACTFCRRRKARN